MHFKLTSQLSGVVRFKVDFQSVLRRLNGLFWFFCFEKLLTSCTTLWNVTICHVLHKVKLQFLFPVIMDVSFTLDEMEERDVEVAARPRQDNISVCTCTRFCLRETGRNACPCRSAQQLPSSTRNCKLAHEHAVCVAGRIFRKWRVIEVSFVFPMWRNFRTAPNVHSIS